jgi:hypothetical protein
VCFRKSLENQEGALPIEWECNDQLRLPENRLTRTVRNRPRARTPPRPARRPPRAEERADAAVVDRENEGEGVAERFPDVRKTIDGLQSMEAT